MVVSQQIKQLEKQSKFLSRLKRLWTYFPARFTIFAFVISYLLLYNNATLFTTIEETLLFHIVRSLGISATYLSGILLAGNTTLMHPVFLPIKIQILIVVFFLALATSARTSVKIRSKILLFGGLCYLSFLSIELLGILLTINFNLGQNLLYKESTILATLITSALLFEAMAFKTLVLPKPTKTTPLIKRSYKVEVFFFALTLVVSLLIYLFIVQVLPVEVDSALGAYAVINVLTMLSMSNYLGYLIWEARTPRWAKLIKFLPPDSPKLKPAVTFLISAFNEEALIVNCIESIDRAASRYSGKTHILVIDDGSEDNTAKVVADTFLKLKYSEGKCFTIPNSGKGTALNFGLKNCSDEIIFRIDADCLIDEKAIGKMVRHFVDPEVASTGGMIFSLSTRSTWEKIFNVSAAMFSSFKRNGDLFDALIIQAGAFSVFRREALIRAGGWPEHQNGEDGELSVRLGRLGYRLNFDDSGLLLSDTPKNLGELRRQRCRWAIAYYHSRARNLNIIRELRGPRSFYFLYNLLGHGLGLISLAFWPFMLAILATGGITGLFSSVWESIQTNISLHPTNLAIRILAVPIYFVIIEAITFSLHYSFAIYFLMKYKMLRMHLPYVYLLRVWFLLILICRMESLGILLSWSSKWKKHDTQSYHDQRRAFSYSMNSWES